MAEMGNITLCARLGAHELMNDNKIDNLNADTYHQLETSADAHNRSGRKRPDGKPHDVRSDTGIAELVKYMHSLNLERVEDGRYALPPPLYPCVPAICAPM